MIRRLFPYLLVFLALVALVIGTFAFDWIGGDGDNAERSVSSSANGADATENGGLVVPAACKGPGGECVWSVQLLADLGTGSNDFDDVSCPGPTLCVAVGNDRYANHYPRQGLMGIWSGGRWKTTRAFESGTKAISCPTTKWCMAVGNDPPHSWSLERSKASAAWQVSTGSPPRPRGARELTLNDVSCASETMCTVAGIYWRQGYKNYVARWDDSKWTLQPAPKPGPKMVGATYGMLGVSCPSTSFCATVGAFNFKPFIEHWDGAEWRIALALGDLPDASLEGISCTSPTACMAVGRLTEKSGETSPFSQRWDGTSWSIVETPPLGEDEDGALSSVSCLSASSCIAVGSLSYPDRSTEEAMAMAWDGTQWTQQDSPAPRVLSDLAGVSCSPTGACTAVGTVGPDLAGNGNTMTLVERFGP